MPYVTSMHDATAEKSIATPTHEDEALVCVTVRLCDQLEMGKQKSEFFQASDEFVRNEVNVSMSKEAAQVTA